MFARNRASFHDDGLAAQRDLFGWGARRPGSYRLKKIGTDGEIIFDVRATIDSHLNRKTEPSSGEGPIAFFGDSFVFGDGLEDHETLPQAFADLNGGKVPVLNFGFPGWAPSQNLIALQTGIYRSQLRSPARFILLTSAFHVERTACKGDYAFGSGPHYVVHGETVNLSGTCLDMMPRYLPSLVRFFRRFTWKSETLTEQDVRTYIEIIGSFVATAKRDYGVCTTLLYNSASDHYYSGTGFTAAKVLDELRARGVDVLVEELPAGIAKDAIKIKGDGHPTGLANLLIARSLDAHLRKVDPKAIGR